MSTKTKDETPKLMDYEQAKKLARHGNPVVRRELAARDDVRSEFLYYLSEDPSPEVRRAVALNPRTPVHVGPLLARDPDLTVRIALAQKLARMLPDLDPDAKAQLFDLCVQSLETLARDQVVKVRAAVASALADVARAPPGLIRTLARDVEEEVASTVLKICALVSEADLLEIISTDPKSWQLVAIASRASVPVDVAEAIISTGDVPATSKLLDNNGAEITEYSIEQLIERSRETKEFQKALARRRKLAPELALKMCDFVDVSVMRLLRNRLDFDPETLSTVLETMRRRVDWIDSKIEEESPAVRARAMLSGGDLTENAVLDALSWNDRVFVLEALALKAQVPPELIDRIFMAGSAKGVVALSWRAGLSMRAAMQLQVKAAGVSPKKVVNAKDGTDYPMTEDEMMQLLEFFGVGS